MIRIAFLLTLVACGRPTPPIPANERSVSTASCQADCTSSITCRDVFSSCRFCSGGICSATLPADPKSPLDAGTDAPGTNH